MTTVRSRNGALPLRMEENGLAPPPRRSLSSRVPPSLALAVVAGILAVLLYLVGTGSSSGVQIAVAARDIGAGQVVDPGAFRFSEVTTSPELVATLLTPKDVSAVRGFVTTHAIAAGGIVARADLASPAAPAQQRAMSIPIDPEHAAGGALRPGDRVDVIDGGGSQPAYVVTNAEVLAVTGDTGGGLAAATRKPSITIAVDATGALRLAGAIAGGKAEIVRATGATVVTPSAPLAPAPLPSSAATTPRRPVS